MPYPSEHSCRLRQPGDFKEKSFRRVTREHKGKEYSVIRGILKSNDEWEDQAFRYKTDTWDNDDARSHCKEHDGTFEAASEASALAGHIERRFMSGVEVRVDDAEGGSLIEGVAAVFYDGTAETEFMLWDGAVERIMPGAFSRAISEEQDVRALFNHDENCVLGRTRAHTLRLWEAGDGLHYQITPAKTSVATDVVEHVRRRDVSGSSFSFRAIEELWRTEESGNIRELRALDLFDVGPVTFPAYETTSVAVRSYQAWQDEEAKRAEEFKQLFTGDLARMRMRWELMHRL